MRKNPIALAAVLIVLVLIVILLGRSGERGPAAEAKEELLFPGLDTAVVDRIVIHAGENGAELVRGGEGAWVVASEDDFPADPEAVERVLEASAELSAASLTSRRPSKHAIFEVDSAQAVEVALEADGEEAARFFVGKSGPDFSSSYVRAGGRDEVYLHPRPVRSVFDRGNRTWRNKRIFDFAREDLARLRVEREGGTLLFENRGDQGWAVLEPEGYRPIGPLVEGLARGFTRLTASDFGGEEEREAAGLENPRARVVLQFTDGTEKTLLIGAEKGEGGGVYVQRGGDDTLFLVPAARIAAVFRKTEELIEPVPADTASAPAPAPEEEP